MAKAEGGTIDNGELRALAAVTYETLRLRCTGTDGCGKELIVADLPEGDGTCDCGRRYVRDRHGSAGWRR